MLKIITQPDTSKGNYKDGLKGYIAFVEGLEEIQGIGTGRTQAIGELMRQLANNTDIVKIEYR